MIQRPSHRRRQIEAIGICASAGGPSALRQILGGLGRASVPIFIVQHVAQNFDSELAKWLDGELACTVRIARNGEIPRAGTAYLAPVDHHMEIMDHRIALTRGPPVSGSRPSADVLFRSMARIFGARCVGILATGMGEDGAFGLADLRRAGAMTIVEDISSAMVASMPKAALSLDPSHRSLHCDLIGHHVRAVIQSRRAKA